MSSLPAVGTLGLAVGAWETGLGFPLPAERAESLSLSHRICLLRWFHAKYEPGRASLLSGLLSLLLSSLTHAQHSGPETVVSAWEDAEPGKEGLYGEPREGRHRGRGQALSGLLDFILLSKDFQCACSEPDSRPAPVDPDLALRKLSVRWKGFTCGGEKATVPCLLLERCCISGILQA